ncbi:MAG: carbohydrate-binding domain-containing protein [Muribaculaceae bacterium]|nr:carbohydrate-binding domain-containing protein [Muribaculaceae bacterium]
MRTTISLFAAVALTVASQAQTLSVSDNTLTYCFPATSDEMPVSEGRILTIGGKTFDMSRFASMMVLAESPVVENQVMINYSPGHTTALIHSSVADYVDVVIDGGHVTVTQSSEVSESTCGEITYILRGEESDGSFTLSGSYKASIELTGLTLTNPAGAAIDIQNGKRISLSAKSSTVNTLADGPGSQKAALYCKGHLELKGKGALTVTGHQAHAISAKEYITVKNLSIEILSSAKDGINCNQYFAMESGTLKINDTADDGIQVSYKDDTDREPEDTGSFTLTGGTINIGIARGAASKGIKADGDVVISAGDVTISTACDGTWDSAKLKTKASACIGADGNVTIDGGTLALSASGSGGKGISCDGVFTSNGGEILINTTGGMLVYSNGSLNHNYTSSADRIASDNKSSAKGIKADSGLVINDGKIRVFTSTNNAEGLESKSTFEIHGGEVFTKAYDDGFNSTSDMTISGGKVTAISVVGDAIDSNANMYITGGEVVALGSGGMEQGLDAADESRCYVYITGGKVLSFGGRNAPVRQTTGSQALVTVAGKIAADTSVSISNDSDTLAVFDIPEEYNSSTGGMLKGPGNGPGGGGWWPGGGSGSGTIMISCPELVSGSKYTVKNGTASSSATATISIN